MKEFAGPLATIIASIAAVAITIYFSRQGLAISKEQLRQARFDRRLEVYLSAVDFYNQLIKWDGSDEQQKARSRFFVALHASYFLFDSDATIETALSELNDSSFAIIGYKEHIAGMPADPAFTREQFEKTQDHLLRYFPSRLASLKSAMKPYMDLSVLSAPSS